jgi:hypothetical protein
MRPFVSYSCGDDWMDEHMVDYIQFIYANDFQVLSLMAFNLLKLDPTLNTNFTAVQYPSASTSQELKSLPCVSTETQTVNNPEKLVKDSKHSHDSVNTIKMFFFLIPCNEKHSLQ